MKKINYRAALLSLFFIVLLSSKLFIYAHTQSTYTIENAWTQLGENGRVFVRAIISGRNFCPDVVFLQNNKRIKQTMQKRENYAQDKYPILVCEQSVPDNVTQIFLDNKILPLLKKSSNRFLLIGDTGCRINGKMVQACNNENLWPFKKIAQEAIRKSPDIIIHLGDYHYRETSCPKDNAGCLGTSSGENWQSWKEDFFSPAKHLLSAAPVVFLRGDHESCGRAGKGWFYFLDPRENQKKCKRHTEPYKIPLDIVTLLAFDSSNVLDNKLNTKNIEEYTKEIKQINNIKSGSNNWFMTHKPVWGIGVPREKRVIEYSNEIKTKELQAVVSEVPFDNTFDLLLAGHIHLFQILSLGKNYPPQLISGNGGTLIEYYTPKTFPEMEIDSKKMEYIKTKKEFGFTILEIEKDHHVKAEMYDLKGHISSICTVVNRKVNCNN